MITLSTQRVTFNSFSLFYIFFIHKRKYFCLPTFNNFAMQNNPLMQLRLIFHKTLIKTNWKSEKLKVLVNLAVFQQLRKLWKGGGGKFILFLSLFLCLQINFQYKLKPHTTLFIVVFYLLSSLTLLIFSNLQFYCFFFNLLLWIILIYKY